MASSEIYIPPAGVMFRLPNKNSKKVLYSSLTAKPSVFHTPQEKVEDNQWWYLIYGTGKNQGKYCIKNKESNQVLFSRQHAQPNVGHTGGNGDYQDNWHKFVPGKGDHVGWFRIFTEAQGGPFVLVSRNHAEPYVANYPTNIIDYEDQHFRFEMEEMVADDSSLVWDFAAAKIVSTERKAVGDVEIKNNTNNEQTYTMNLTEEIVIQGTAERVGGFPLQNGVKFTSELPTIASTNLAQVASNQEKVQWALGSQVLSNKMVTTEREFYVDAKSSAHAFATAAVMKIEVPFTTKAKGKRSSTLVTTNGIWRGTISGLDLKVEVKKA
jgi:hypothetical protein